MKKIVSLAFIVLVALLKVSSQNIISEKNTPGSFSIVSISTATPILVDEKDHSVVHKAAGFLQTDIEMLTGQKPLLVSVSSVPGNLIIIGSLDKSEIINRLVKEKKLNVDKIKGQWEGYQMQVVREPMKGVNAALVITGSDRRGTAFGIFELSRQMGVSPWYWWADVPVKKKKEIYLLNPSLKSDAPKVKYRGIFINDEAPALSGWSKEKFGGLNTGFMKKYLS